MGQSMLYFTLSALGFGLGQPEVGSALLLRALNTQQPAYTAPPLMPAYPAPAPVQPYSVALPNRSHLPPIQAGHAPAPVAPGWTPTLKPYVAPTVQQVARQAYTPPVRLDSVNPGPRLIYRR